MNPRNDQELLDQQREDAVNAYAEAMIKRDQREGGFYAARAQSSGWLYGVADRPSDQINWDKEKK